MKSSGIRSGSVVSGEPQRGQERRNTRRPLDPTSSKTAVSPVIVSALWCMKMTVENPDPDCGRQRLQWQSASAIYFSVIL
jgi:hypothetical protein